MRRLLIALVLLVASGCGSRQQLVAEEPAPPDDADQQGWANTSPVGSGEDVGSGYYGVGHSQPGQPERTAAEPAPVRRSPWR